MSSVTTKSYAELFSTVPITEALPEIVIKMGTETNIDYSEYLQAAEKYKEYFSKGLKYEDSAYGEFREIESFIQKAIGALQEKLTPDTFLSLLLSPRKPDNKDKSGSVIYNLFLPEDGLDVLLESLGNLPLSSTATDVLLTCEDLDPNYAIESMINFNIVKNLASVDFPIVGKNGYVFPASVSIDDINYNSISTYVEYIEVTLAKVLINNTISHHDFMFFVESCRNIVLVLNRNKSYYGMIDGVIIVICYFYTVSEKKSLQTLISFANIYIASICELDDRPFILQAGLSGSSSGHRDLIMNSSEITEDELPMYEVIMNMLLTSSVLWTAFSIQTGVKHLYKKELFRNIVLSESIDELKDNLVAFYTHIHPSERLLNRDRKNTAESESTLGYKNDFTITRSVKVVEGLLIQTAKKILTKYK